MPRRRQRQSKVKKRCNDKKNCKRGLDCRFRHTQDEMNWFLKKRISTSDSNQKLDNAIYTLSKLQKDKNDINNQKKVMQQILKSPLFFCLTPCT